MSSGKSVEDSFSSQLATLLQKRGINAIFKKSFTTVLGRQEPDIVIDTDEGLFLIEAKMPPAGLPQAMEQLSKYHNGIGRTEHIAGTCAVVYNSTFQEVFYSAEKSLDLQKFRTLDDTADYIAKKIEEKPTILAPVSTQKIIRILDDSVMLLSRSLTKMPKEEIEEIFGGKHFFNTVLDYKEEEGTSPQALKNAAAYLLVNQILFYHLLSSEVKDFPPIDTDELKSGSDLQNKYFNVVLKHDYAAIFGFNVAAAIKDKKATSALATAVAAIQVLSPKVLSHELLGKIFHNLIPLSLRKVVAAYYTNSEAAELLAHLAVENKNDKVIDPACGSGTLLVAAYNRKKALTKQFTDSDHKRFLEHDIYGSDIMPFAAHLAAVSLALQAPLSYTNVVDIAIHDSTELAPGMKITAAQDVIRESYKLTTLKDFARGPPSKRPKIKKGVIDLLQQQREITLPQFDVVIMNPPFTKFQRIPPEYKKKLAERFSASRYRDIVHGQMGLHGYFLLLADKFLKPGGRIAAVLPLTTISLEGFYGVIELLLKDYTIEHVIVSSGRAAFSENTSLREILLVARKQKPLPESTTKFTFIHASPEHLTVDHAREIAQAIQEIDEDEQYNDDFYIRRINQKNLGNDLRSLYQTVTLHSPDLVKIDSKVRRWFTQNNMFCDLQSLEQKEKWRISENPRGVQKKGYYVLSLIGSEERALKDHDVWIVEEDMAQTLKVRQRFNNQRFRIPKSCVVPQFRRFSGEHHISLAPPLDYLVVRRFEGFENFLKASTQADERLQRTILSGIRDGEWEQFVRKNSASVFGFYRGDITAPGSAMLCIRSDKPAFAGPGGSWVFYAPPTHDTVTSLWLNSSIPFYHILRDRKETRGGFVELDKYVFLDMPYPVESRIDRKLLEQLNRSLSGASFPSLLEQFQTSFEPRKKLDMFFLELAGVPKPEAEKFLKLLYDTLAKELLRLKGVMGK